MVILDEEYSPFSFLDAIYLSRNYLINDEMEERIFLHEKCHVRENTVLIFCFWNF